jgi:hypothetical protein
MTDFSKPSMLRAWLEDGEFELAEKLAIAVWNEFGADTNNRIMVSALVACLGSLIGSAPDEARLDLYKFTVHALADAVNRTVAVREVAAAEEESCQHTQH